MTRLAPSAAAYFAVANPMPELPPMRMILLPSRDGFKRCDCAALFVAAAGLEDDVTVRAGADEDVWFAMFIVFILTTQRSGCGCAGRLPNGKKVSGLDLFYDGDDVFVAKGWLG